MTKVKLQNVGNRTEIFTWPSQPLTYRKVSVDHGNRLSLGGPTGQRMSDMITTRESGLRLKPGTTFHLTFVARVLEPGMYYVHFFAESSPAEQQLATTEGIQHSVGWAEDSYLAVSDTKCVDR